MSDRSLDRRAFLRAAGLTVAAASLGPRLSSLFGGTSAEAEVLRGLAGGSLLDLPAKQSPIDHVVVLMMENRSFDHFLGWLANDRKYLENGRRRHGRGFYVEGDQIQSFRDTEGRRVRTYYLPDQKDEANPYRGCGHPDPGHGWDAGRAQRDRGFLAKDTGNDEFAIGYYNDVDVPLYAKLARRFTTFDRYHCSVLGPTYPNREYLHSAQSGGHKANDTATDSIGFEWTTIWDRLIAAGVPTGYYFVDLPVTALWGARLAPISHHLERFFAECEAGTLPNVTFVDPGFLSDMRTDDHPHGDMRAGQRYVFNVFKAFATSPLWERGAFFLTYDEWGGFFDHVRPPILPDDRASKKDVENFGQAGFRVPTFMASPFAHEGYIDHRLYDHTSILRFIEWRFLGAPAEGGRKPGKWYLTSRDRHALNIGLSLRPSGAKPDVELDAMPQVPVTSGPCGGAEVDTYLEKSPFEQHYEAGYFARAGYKIDLRPLPYPTDD